MKPAGVAVTSTVHYKRLLKTVKNLTKKDVLVGIPADEGGRDTEINNAQLGYIHENGAPDVGIPARPSLFPGIRDAQQPIAQFLAVAAKALINGKEGKADQALHAAGLLAVSAVQARIRRGDFVPLKASTIRRRRIRTKGSKYRRKATTAAQVTPLIDSGQFIRSFTYIVRKGGAAE